ncbi:MAG: ABC transporter permease [Oscillospiraceae bacterium]|nr:ABC transporter permease [Oscillospiraceae bacterium]
MSIRATFINILRSRTRSLLTMSGIAIGVLSVTLISAVGTIGTAQVDSTLVSMGVDTLLVSSAGNTVSAKLTDESISAVRRTDGVADVMPLMASVSEAQMAGRRLDCYLWGVDDSADKLISLTAKHGRLITTGDAQSDARVCVVDESFALEVYGRSNIIGKTMRLFVGGRYHDFTVVGVAGTGLSGLQSALTGIMPGFMYIPITTMQTLSGRSTYDRLAVKLDVQCDEAAVLSAVRAAIDRVSGCTDGFIINNLLSQKKSLDEILAVVTVSLSLVAGISLLVSGISVMTTMMMSVTERTREIGIRKAIGAKNCDICMEFISEGIMLTFAGGTAGLVAGLVIAAVGCMVLRLPFAVDPVSLIICEVSAVVIGAVFGAFPAYRAAKMKPVDALKTE